MTKRILHKLYDIITKKTIVIYKNELGKTAAELSVDLTAISHVASGKHLHINPRYILEKNKDKIFTLVDADSKEEYDCISLTTMFQYHWKMPYDTHTAKLICNLKHPHARQDYASLLVKYIILNLNRP